MNRFIRHRWQWKNASVWLLLVLVLLWLGVINPGVVQAHAILLRSTPEANAELATSPATIELWFSEPLEASFSTARLLDSQGAEVRTGAATLDPADPTHLTLPLAPLGPGIYTVVWQTLSRADGHEWYGSFPLTILNPDGTRPTTTSVSGGGAERGELPTLGEVIARWLVLLGGIFLFGVPLFQSVVAPAGQGLSAGNNTGLPFVSRNLALRLVWGAVLAIILGSWLQVILQTFRLGGLDRLPSLLLETRTGDLSLARQALAFSSLVVALKLPQPWPFARPKRPILFIGVAYNVLVILSFLWISSPDSLILALVLMAGLGIALANLTRQDGSPTIEPGTWYISLALGGVLLFSISLSSHAGAGAGSVWAVTADFIHLLAAAAWLGGLAMLPILIWQLRQKAASSDYPQFLALIRRFSYLASFAVFVVIVTGLFRSLVELPGISSLWSSPYGLVLSVKLVIMVFTLEAARFNNRLVHRHPDQLEQAAGWQYLNRQIVMETLLSLGLTVSVAILVQTPTPRSLTQTANVVQPALPFETLARADDLFLHVQITPNQVGYNQFWVHLYHPDGQSIGEVQLVRLLFNYRQEQLGQAKADLVSFGQDTFATEGAYLNGAGQWDLSVYIRRRNMDDALAKVTLDVPLPTNSVSGANLWANPVDTLPGSMMIGGVFVVVGLIPLLWDQPLREIFRLKPPKVRVWAWPPSALTLSGGITILVGLLITAASVPPLLADLTAKSLNPLPTVSADSAPVPSTLSSVVAGHDLYQKQCVPCHGAGGLGDGPRAATMDPPPANFMIKVPVHTDRALYRYISQGFPGTAMPGFTDKLTEKEIWHLVNYLRAQFGRRK